MRPDRNAHSTWALALATVAWVAGCASVALPPADPQPYLARAMAQPVVHDSVEVRVAVLRAEESQASFGLALADKGVQPVWIRIENRSSTGWRLLPAQLDRDYFAAHEVGRMFGGGRAGSPVDSMLAAREIPLEVAPGATVVGYLYTNRTRGLKLVNIELVRPNRTLRFAFARELPSGNFDFRQVDVGRLYAGRTRAVDLDALRDSIALLPKTTTDADGRGAGDPLNLVFVGTEHNLLTVLVRAGWDFTDITSAGSVGRMLSAFFSGASYRTSPVSPLYVDGRRQDLSMQRMRSTISRRNHLRLWATPYQVGDTPVWIGQISRDVGVRMTSRPWTFVTHAIAPDVDEARDYLLQTLLIDGSVERWGYAGGVGAATPSAPRHNLGGDPWFSDGLRLVVVVSPDRKAPGTYGVLNWERATPPR